MIGGIALILVIAGFVFVPKIISQPDMIVRPTDTIEELKPLTIKGLIDNKIGFSMHLYRKGNQVEGTEHYDNQKADAILTIKGSTKDNGLIILYEYIHDDKKGSFAGYIDDENVK